MAERRNVQHSNNLLRLLARVLRKDARHNLQRLGKRVDGVLLQAGDRLGVRDQAPCQLNLRGTGAGNKALLGGDRLIHVDTVVNGALDVVHSVGCGTTHNDGRDLGTT